MNKLKETIYKVKHNTTDIKEAMEKELGFGCYFMWKEEIKDEFELQAVFEHWKSKQWKTIRAIGSLGQQLIIDKSHITKIIGTPITLADVLRAVYKKPLPKHFLVLPSGHIYLFESGYLEEPVAFWSLDKDLDGQTEKTKKFIRDLLLTP